MATGTEQQATPTAQPASITLTEVAAQKVRDILQTEGQNVEEVALRLKVVGGGCSGYSYELAFDAPNEQDQVSESHGVKVVVDPRSLLFLAGSQVDYVESMMGSGFKVENPNITGTCGCGHSFKV